MRLTSLFADPLPVRRLSTLFAGLATCFAGSCRLGVLFASSTPYSQAKIGVRRLSSLYARTSPYWQGSIGPSLSPVPLGSAGVTLGVTGPALVRPGGRGDLDRHLRLHRNGFIAAILYTHGIALALAQFQRSALDQLVKPLPACLSPI